MGSLSNYAENEILDHLLGIGEFAIPTVYIGLCTADPTDAGTGASCNEVANANGYARLALAADLGTPAAAGAVANDGAIEFAAASGGDWGTVTHFVIVDSGTHGAGNVIFHGALASSKTVEDGDTFTIPIGDLDITAD